jgi:hypothetical protein
MIVVDAELVRLIQAAVQITKDTVAKSRRAAVEVVQQTAETLEKVRRTRELLNRPLRNELS